MAITYGTKLFESTTTGATTTVTIGSNIVAGTLVAVGIGGTCGSSLDISSIASLGGGTWDWSSLTSTTRFAAVAWVRVNSSVSSGTTCVFTWNHTPTKIWLSGHSYLNADDAEIAKTTGSGSLPNATKAVTVSGSDWLTFASVTLASEFSISGGAKTNLNSATLRDDNAATSAPWCECLSYNGTTGSSYTAGLTYTGTTTNYAIAVVSLPYKALPSGPRARIIWS